MSAVPAAAAPLPVVEARGVGAGGSVAGLDGAPYLAFDAFADWGVRALVTTRAAGTFSTASDEPAHAVAARWDALQRHLFRAGDGRLVTARQVHGAAILEHRPGWTGWLRGHDADGHLAAERGTAMAVTVADCVPVFVAHPSGAAAMLHSGWRSTAAGILGVAVGRLAALGCAPGDLRVLLGPAICGRCYEVSPEVHAALGAAVPAGPAPIDLHGVIAAQARAAGVRDVRASALCTRCDGALLFSHRAGNAGRQLGVLLAEP